MNVSDNAKRIHPLVAVAAVAVTLVSLLGMAAITGYLPNSYGRSSDVPSSAAQALAAPATTAVVVPVARERVKGNTGRAPQASQVATAEPVLRSSPTVPAPQPVAKAPPKNSPIGIGLGALIGGVLGNQVGSGDGKTLATIAGAVGGGYIGNEVAKRNQ